MKHSIISLVFLFFFAVQGYAIEPLNSDTCKLPASAVKWFSESQLANPAIAKPNFIDTTLTQFQKYKFAYRERSFFSHKGNIGHAHRSLIFSPTTKINSFSYLRNEIYKGHLFTHKNIKFYRPEYVFTDLYYVMGGRPEQSFYALHSQRLSENFVTTLKYQLIRAPGLYSRIESNNANFYGSADYVSDDERYQLLGSFIWNRMINQESGGLINPEGFEEDEQRDSVLLYNATGLYRETAVNIHQYYQLGFYRNKNNNNNGNKFVNMGKVSHKFSYNRKSYIFDEKSSPYSFFEGFPKADSLQTYDSTIVHNISNRISYSNYRLGEERSGFPVFFNIFLEHNFYSIHHPFNLRNDFNQYTQGIKIYSDRKRKFSFNGLYNYTLGGYNDEDFTLSLGGRYNNPERESNILEVNLSYHEKEAPYLMNKFFSNYVFWDNSFDKTKISNAGISYKNNYFTIDLNIYNLENFHYFNNEALPQQADNSFMVSSAGLKSNLSFGVFRFKNHLIYQHLSDDSYEQFPELVSYHSFYADLILFDKALYGNIGLDAGYNSPYYAQSYMPVHKQFYTQNDYETPHLVFLDAFINAKISRARLFLKWQNPGALLWDQPPIYTIPFYPYPESIIRFGVSWMFYD